MKLNMIEHFYKSSKLENLQIHVRTLVNISLGEFHIGENIHIAFYEM